MTTKEQVIELAKQAGIDSMPSDMNYRSPYYACTPDELKAFSTLVGNAKLKEAAGKLRALGHANLTTAIAAIESLREPTP